MKNTLIKIGYVIGLFLITLPFVSFNNDSRFKSTATKADIIELINLNKLNETVNVEAFIDEAYIDDKGVGDDNIIYSDIEGSQHFEVEEFIRFDDNPSKETIKKIKEIHIPELEKVRSVVDEPIIIRSSSRTFRHEKKMGRSGNSNHVFSRGDGAVDISLKDYSKKKLDELEHAVIDTTEYNRISRYKTYLHLDFGKNRFGGRAYYRNTTKGWIYIGKIRN